MWSRCSRVGLGDLSGQIISISLFSLLKTYSEGQDVVTAGTEAGAEAVAEE